MHVPDEIIAKPTTSLSYPFSIDGEAVIPEAVMLAELQHRMANEFASAMATLQVARRHVADRDRASIDEAIGRLGEQAALSRVLLPPLRSGTVDLRRSVERLCLGLSRARLENEGIAIVVDVPRIDLASRTCWMLGAVIAELTLNAAKHAFAHVPAGSVLRGSVRVEGWTEGRALLLRVVDDGAGADRGRRSVPGQGSAVMSALLASLNAEFDRTASAGGTAVGLRLAI